MKHLLSKLKSGLMILMAVTLSLPLSSIPVSANGTNPPSVQNPAEVTVDGIKLSKTAKPVEGVVNQWDVTLEIEAPKTSQTSDIVLVIDTSGSMGYNNNQRLKKAKEAANKFIDKFLPSSTTKIGLVTFDEEAYVKSQLTSSANALKNIVNNLSASGGTHTQAGLRWAQGVLGSSTADNKHIVLLSDGRPTYSYQIPNHATRRSGYVVSGADYYTGTNYSSGAYGNSRVGSGSSIFQYIENYNGRSAYYHHGNSAIAQASFAKNANHRVWSIALEVDATGQSVLQGIASPDSYYTATSTDLEAIFNTIAGGIANYIQSASVVDTMGNGIKLTGGGEVLDWTPSFTQVGNKFVATKTYRIELDGTKLVGGVNSWYNANQSAILTYNNNKTGEFPIPKVDPTLVKIKKVLDGDVCDGCKYTFKLTAPDNSVEYHEVEAGQTKTLYHPMKVGNYTIIEDSAKDAGGNSISLGQYDTTISPANTYALALAGADVAITATNKLKTTDVEATKVWSGGENLGTARPTVWFKLFRQVGNGTAEAVPGAVIKKLDGITSVKWEGIASHRSSDGQAYTFSVKEVDANGNNFTPANYTKVENGLTVTNTYVPKKINITGHKSWVNGENFKGGVRPNIQLQLKQNNTNYGDPVTISHGTLSHTWTNVPETDANGNAYSYTVDEVDVPDNYQRTFSEDKLTVINTYNPEKINLAVKKSWVNGQNIIPSSIKVDLYRNGDKQEGMEKTLTNSLPTPWEATWTGLPKTDDQGNPYTYAVKEQNVVAGFIPSYASDDGLNWKITNTYNIPNDGKATATKAWVNGPTNDRPDVWFKLYRQITGGTVEEVPVAEAPIQKLVGGTASVTWTGLKETDKDGNTYTFSVKEVDENGNNFTPTNYTKKEEGLLVTNTYVIPTDGEATATKKWTSGPSEHPTVWFQLYRKVGSGAAKKVPGAEIKKLANGTTSVTWTGLETTDINGKAYKFSVKEVDSVGNDFTPTNYSKKEKGLKVTNTYVIPTNGEAKATKTWVDGPSTHPTVWFKLFRNISGGTEQAVPGADIKELVDGTKDVTWTDLEETDKNGNAYTFSVKEVNASGGDFTPANYTKSGEGTLEITNTYVQPETDIDIVGTKEWVNGPETKPTVSFELWRKNGTAGTGERVVAATELTGTTVNFGKQLKTDINGVEYEYYVKEVDVPANYSKDEAGLVITNTYVSPKINVSVKKIWIGGPSFGQKANFQLYRDGKVLDGAKAGTIIGSDVYTWYNLDKTDKDGVEYEYTVREVNVPGFYKPTITGSVEDGFVVTNTYIESGRGGGDPVVTERLADTGSNIKVMIFGAGLILLAGAYLAIARRQTA